MPLRINAILGEFHYAVSIYDECGAYDFRTGAIDILYHPIIITSFPFSIRQQAEGYPVLLNKFLVNKNCQGCLASKNKAKLIFSKLGALLFHLIRYKNIYIMFTK